MDLNSRAADGIQTLKMVASSSNNPDLWAITRAEFVFEAANITTYSVGDENGPAAFTIATFLPRVAALYGERTHWLLPITPRLMVRRPLHTRITSGTSIHMEYSAPQWNYNEKFWHCRNCESGLCYNQRRILYDATAVLKVTGQLIVGGCTRTFSDDGGVVDYGTIRLATLFRNGCKPTGH